MDKVTERLEDKLRTTWGPAMPVSVEARIRQRIHSELASKPCVPVRPRFLQRASIAQMVMVAVLMLAAGWVVVHNIIPMIQSTWERFCR